MARKEINYDYLSVQVYKRLNNLAKAGIVNEATLQLQANVEMFQAKHNLSGGGKFGTNIKKSYTPQQKAQMAAIIENFLDQTGSSVSAIKKSYKDFERGLEKLGKQYKLPATPKQMADRLDRQEKIAAEARMRNQLPSEYIQQAYEMQKQFGWSTGTTEVFLQHMAERAEQGANIEEIWDPALDDLRYAWETRVSNEFGGFELPWQ